MTNRQRRVLVVDDDQSVSATLSRRLRSAGYDVIATTDANDIFVRITETDPDLILLDRRLGELDGLELLAVLKAADTTRDIPVVIVSGCGSDEREALNAGASGFLEKPFGGRQLVELVDSVGSG